MYKMLLPNAIEIKAKELEDGRWEVEYYEKFKDSPELEKTNTEEGRSIIAAALKRRGAYNIEHKENSIRFHLKNSREEVFGALAAEFMANSPLGTMCLKDILGSLVVLEQKATENSTKTPKLL